VAASLKKEPGVEVEVVNGDHGEFTVSVDGRTVAKRGDTLPSADEVLAAVKKAVPAKTV
jgi:hypothetical protein